MFRKSYLAFILILTIILQFQLGVQAQTKNRNIFQSIGHKIKQTGGVGVGFPVGSFVGGFRGAITEMKSGTEYTAEFLGNKDGSVHRTIGFFTGGLFRSFGGGFGGAIKGAHDGIYYGRREPFSKKSLSLAGDYLTDYDFYGN